jgi:hypothetical protein
VHGVSKARTLGGVNLEFAAAIRTEVVHIRGVGPLGIDRRVSVKGTLKYKDQNLSENCEISSSLNELFSNSNYVYSLHTTPELRPTGASKLSPRWVSTLTLVM